MGQCLPFLQIASPGHLIGKITYVGQPIFEYTEHLFHGRVTYATFNLEMGSGPWITVRTRDIAPGWTWGRELKFDEDDRKGDTVFYRTAAERQNNTVRFWEQVDTVTWRVRDLAWREMIRQVQARRLWPALVAARMVAGATWWLNRHMIPLRGRHVTAIRRADTILLRQIEEASHAAN